MSPESGQDLPHTGLHQRATDSPADVHLFGLRLSDVTLRYAAESAVNRARTGPKLHIFFVNAH